MVLAAAMLAPARLFSRLYDVALYGDALRDWAAGLGLAKNATVLELGCGPGRLAAELMASGHDVIAADTSPRMIRAARRRGVQARLIEPGRLPFGSGVFDATLGASLINVLAEPAALLGEAARVTRAGGLVSMFFPGPAFDHAAAERAVQGLGRIDRALFTTWASVARKLAPDRVSDWMRGAGFQEVGVTDFLDGSLHAATGRLTAASVPR